MRKLIAGRKVPCSHCGDGTVSGTSQVYRKLLFHFCPTCWTPLRAACHRFMEAVAA